MLSALLEKLLINFPDMQRLFDPATNIVLNHEASQLITIYQYNPLAQMFCCFPSRGGKSRGRYE
jgi:hypothetical protein